jgi:hypothetical protein
MARELDLEKGAGFFEKIMQQNKDWKPSAMQLDAIMP